MAALLFEVFTLSIRTAAKPLAGRFQAWVLDHPTLRPAVINLAQVPVAKQKLHTGDCRT